VILQQPQLVWATLRDASLLRPVVAKQGVLARAKEGVLFGRRCLMIIMIHGKNIRGKLKIKNYNDFFTAERFKS
jgi:hypothetical protein